MVGSPVKAQGTGHHLSTRDIPCTAFRADRSRVHSPRPPREASHDQGRQETRLTVGAELPYFHNGRGSTTFTVATGPRDKTLPTIGEEMACQNFAQSVTEQLAKGREPPKATVLKQLWSTEVSLDTKFKKKSVSVIPAILTSPKNAMPFQDLM